MTETQANDLINAVNGVRTDLSSVRADLAALRGDVQAYHPYALGSTYAISTSVGVQDLRIERAVSVGDIFTTSLMISLLLVVAVKYLFGSFRGVGL